MKLKGKNILLISPEPWDHIFVSKHHYAQNLAKLGNRVVFVNPPHTKWNIVSTQYPNLNVLDYPGFIPGLRKLPAFCSRRLIKKKFRQIEKFCDIQFDVVWSFDNSVFFDFSLLPTFNISHIVDLNQNFELGKAAVTADICFHSSDPIGTRIKQYNKNSHFINHGYNPVEQSEFINLPEGQGNLKIGYAGNLSIPYIDWSILNKAFGQMSNHDFYLAGPGDPSLEKKYSNLHLVGKLDKNQLSSFYAQMDLLIICYEADKYVDQLANPHKMLEYLGTGKPIVSSRTICYENLTSICMSNVQSQWLTQLESLIDNFQYWNSSELVSQRKSIAHSNSYSTQIHKIESIIHGI